MLAEDADATMMSKQGMVCVDEEAPALQQRMLPLLSKRGYGQASMHEQRHTSSQSAASSALLLVLYLSCWWFCVKADVYGAEKLPACRNIVVKIGSCPLSVGYL